MVAAMPQDEDWNGAIADHADFPREVAMLAEANVGPDIQKAAQVLLAAFERLPSLSVALQSFLSCLTLGDPETSHSCSPSRGEMETEWSISSANATAYKMRSNLQNRFVSP